MADEDANQGKPAVSEDEPSRAGRWNEQADQEPPRTPRKRSGLADMLWGDDERPIVRTPPSSR